MTNKMPVPKGHTPGPWFYGKMYGEDDILPGAISIGNFEADDHYEDTICEVWDGNHNAEANAKLIVAAVNHYLGLDKEECKTCGDVGWVRYNQGMPTPCPDC